MTVQSLPNKFQVILPYLFGLVSFLGGFYVNYLSYTNKVDTLSSTVKALSESVDNLSKQIQAGNENYNSLDKRVSKVEFYLFEYKKPVSQ